MNQDQALELLLAGKSALITGKAGSGKTHLLNEFISRVKKDKKLAITATTGIAATHLNGETIHRWSKIGILEQLNKDFFNKLTKKDRQRLIETDVLIIDEISMLHDWQFDLINQVLKTVRAKFEPFGGVQLVLSGDFFQLPPVKKRQSVQLDVFGSGSESGFVVGSASFEELNPIICYLETQYRQDDDDLTSILDAIRSGIIDQYEIDKLQSRMNLKSKQTDNLAVTNLYTTNADVERINQTNLDKIQQPVKSFVMTGSGNKYQLESLKKSVLAPEVLKLKLEAYVMTVKNDSKERFVNGSLGQIIDFAQKDGLDCPVVRFNDGQKIIIEPTSWDLMENGQKLASVTQIPLRLAYAITIHKAQGMTLDRAIIDLSKAFTPGMGYVALSRVRNLDNLFLTGLNQMALTVSEEAMELDNQMKKRARANNYDKI